MRHVQDRRAPYDSFLIIGEEDVVDPIKLRGCRYIKIFIHKNNPVDITIFEPHISVMGSYYGTIHYFE